MPNQEETRKSNMERKRSYLFLSMILLVFNLAATANLFFRNSSHGFPQASDSLSVSAVPASLSPLQNIPMIQQEPLSLRQKYLLGKRIDINEASMEEFSSLPGISNAMAAAMVAEREQLGAFRSPNDLLRVKGIKEKRLEKILPFLKQ